MMKANMKSGTTLLRTPFWKAAYQSLPDTVRQRYLAYIQHAERWDLALDAGIEALWPGCSIRPPGRARRTERLLRRSRDLTPPPPPWSVARTASILRDALQSPSFFSQRCSSPELRAEVVPGALEQARVPELLAAQRDLPLAEGIGLADLQRHVLPVGVLLEIVGEHERFDDVLADRHRAVRLHQ